MTQTTLPSSLLSWIELKSFSAFRMLSLGNPLSYDWTSQSNPAGVPPSLILPWGIAAEFLSRYTMPRSKQNPLCQRIRQVDKYLRGYGINLRPKQTRGPPLKGK